MSDENINPLHPLVGRTHQSGFSELASAFPGVFRLPQTVYTTEISPTSYVRHLSPSIAFDIKGNGGESAGFSMNDLCNRGLSVLAGVMEGGKDRVLQYAPQGKITFRIMWPGYAHVPSVYSIDVSSEYPMTRARLGQIIAERFARFIERNSAMICSQPLYTMGPNGIRLEHLFLLSLQNTCDDSWQADVVVDMRLG